MPHDITPVLNGVGSLAPCSEGEWAPRKPWMPQEVSVGKKQTWDLGSCYMILEEGSNKWDFAKDPFCQEAGVIL